MNNAKDTTQQSPAEKDVKLPPWFIVRDYKASKKDIETLKQFCKELRACFPTLAKDFDETWATWVQSLVDKDLDSASSEEYTTGPEWNDLLDIGAVSLPLVVEKLETGLCDFALPLCEYISASFQQSDLRQGPNGRRLANSFRYLDNILQTDQMRKLTRFELRYLNVESRAQRIVSLYVEQIHEFNDLAANWKQDIRRLKKYRRTNGHEGLVILGPPALPLILHRLFQDRDQWWHRVIDEIEGTEPWIDSV